ncbi:MAG: c-type cytochrome, partial [Nitriliruptorales bacterium]
LGLIVAGALAATAATAQTPAGTEAPEDGIVQRGEALYSQHCATCHGAEGRGSVRAGIEVPPVQDASPALVDFVIRTGRMPMPNIEAGSVRRRPVLDDEQRRALVAYFQTFAADAPHVPVVDADRGDVAEGRDVYVRNCVACHGAFGRGIAISQEDIAPGLLDAAPVEVAEAVRTGPGVMPVFGKEIISDPEVASVIAYVDFVTRQAERPAGGLTIGRSGPVTEGLVAWGVGFVLLVVAIYFIGEARRD